MLYRLSGKMEQMKLAQRLNAQIAAINSAATGNTTIITNPSKIAFMYVWESAPVVGAATNITFMNGAGVLSGPVSMLANGSIYRPDRQSRLHHRPRRVLYCHVNSSGTTVQQSGWVKWSN